MRKLLFTLVSCLAITAVAVASCSSDDGPVKIEPAKVEISYEIAVSKALFDYCDLVISYTDENGNTKNEKVGNASGKANVVCTKLPVVVSCKFFAKIKSAITADDIKEESVSVGYNYSLTCKSFDTNDKIIDSYNTSANGNTSFAKNKFIEDFSAEGRYIDFGSVTVDAEGKMQH